MTDAQLCEDLIEEVVSLRQQIRSLTGEAPLVDHDRQHVVVGYPVAQWDKLNGTRPA